MSKDNFSLRVFKNGKELKSKQFATSLDAEYGAYDLIESLEMNEDTDCDNIIITENVNNTKVFNALYENYRGRWKVDMNDIHDEDDLEIVDDSMLVDTKKRSKKNLKEAMDIIAIVPCGDLMPGRDDNSFMKYYLAGKNVDADNVCDTVDCLRSGNACGSYVLDNDTDDGMFFDFVKSNEECPDGICCLDDCRTNSPDEFFISKKVDDFYPVEKEDEIQEEAYHLNSRSRDGVNKKYIEIPEDRHATVFGHPYTWAEEDANSALHEMNIPEEEIEEWRETGEAPFSTGKFARALKKAQDYDETQIMEVLPVLVALLEKNGYKFREAEPDLHSREGQRAGRTLAKDALNKYKYFATHDIYGHDMMADPEDYDDFEYDDEY